MRIASSALMTLTVVTVPSLGFAQVLTPFDSMPTAYDQRLDHPVPVATVSRVADIVALDGARVVQDGHGEPFVLGVARLDLRDPVHAKVVFDMTNANGTPILLDDVMIDETRLCSSPDQNYPFVYPSTGYRAGGFHGTGQMEPGEKVTVQIPAPPNCGGKNWQTVAVVVAVHRPGPHEFTSTPRPAGITEFHANKDLIFRVLDRMRAEASQH